MATKLKSKMRTLYCKISECAYELIRIRAIIRRVSMASIVRDAIDYAYGPNGALIDSDGRAIFRRERKVPVFRDPDPTT